MKKENIARLGKGEMKKKMEGHAVCHLYDDHPVFIWHHICGG